MAEYINMFLNVTVQDNRGRSWVEVINPFHISRVKQWDLKNIDAGCVIFMKSGDQLYTPEPIDVMHIRIDEVIQGLSASVIMQVAGEYVKQNTPKRGRPRKTQ